MTFKTAHAPHLRRTDNVRTLNMDVLITIVPLCIFSAVYYGLRPVFLILAGIATAMVCELLCCLLMKRTPTVMDGTAAVTGGLIGALMSPMAPYWMPVVGAAFAILVVKMPMGGTGRNLFNPAAAGVAILTLCFRSMFAYPDPGYGKQLPIAGLIPPGIVETSPAAQLVSHGQTLYSAQTLLLGGFPGPIGATAILILAACLLYLVSRRAVSVLITLPYLGTCAAMAALFPRMSGGVVSSVTIELCSGYLLFCGIFLLNDPVTSPRNWLARILYGVIAGVLVMLLRYFGRFEEGACFAVLLVNAFASTLDRLCWHVLNLRRQKERKEGASI